MENSNQRTYYRIVYPATTRPRLRTGTQVCEVLDCSEHGLCYRPSAPPLPELGTEVQGQVLFPGGAKAAVRGRVVRVNEEEVAMHLTDQSIPFSLILREQLYLRTRTMLSTP